MVRNNAMLIIKEVKRDLSEATHYPATVLLIYFLRKGTLIKAEFINLAISVFTASVLP